MTALLMPVIVGTAGLAVDVSNALAARQQMQGAADAAALAAANSLTQKTQTVPAATAVAQEFALAQTGNVENRNVDVSIGSKLLTNLSKEYDIEVRIAGNVPTTFSRVIGYDSIPIKVEGAAISSTAGQPSISMYLVLDRSGSMDASVPSAVDPTVKSCEFKYMNDAQTALLSKGMQSPCYYSRMDVLQQSVSSLLDTLADDKKQMYIRTGADAFSSSRFTPQDLGWDTSAVKTYVNAMTPSGGTSSTGAFTEAVSALTKLTEDSAHLTKNGGVPKKFIVFMTDGENNSTSDNTATLAQCTKAKASGITVYTVGFMLVTSNSKNLLYNCASSAQTYFDAQDGTRLAAAFQQIAQQTTNAAPRLSQ